MDVSPAATLCDFIKPFFETFYALLDFPSVFTIGSKQSRRICFSTVAIRVEHEQANFPESPPVFGIDITGAFHPDRTVSPHGHEVIFLPIEAFQAK